MEIKLLCACGAKFKFDVEPVSGVMPWPVKCPVCSADGTAQANAILQQTFSAPPIAVAPPTEIAPPPGVRAATPAAPAPAAPPPVARLNRPQAAPPPIPVQPPSPAPFKTEAYTPPPPRRMAAAAAPEDGDGKNAKFIALGIVLVMIVTLGLGAWKFGRKWYNSISAVAEVAEALGGSDSDSWQSNLDYAEQVTLFVKHKDHQAVADACREFWQAKWQKTITVTSAPADEGVEEGEYEIQPSHNGWVRLFGPLEWRPAHYEALAIHLSEKFGTLVFETSDEDDSGAFHFGAYDTGTRKFHARMEIKITDDDLIYKATTEGNDWAVANGFVPGEDGFQKFDIGDADKITQKLGMKFWDEKFDEDRMSLLLKESPGAGSQPRD